MGSSISGPASFPIDPTPLPTNRSTFGRIGRGVIMLYFMIASRAVNDCHDHSLVLVRQLVPRFHNQLQVGVKKLAVAIHCTGICTTLERDMRISRGIVTLFESYRES